MSFPGNAPPVQSGFTLIELIAVIVILAILAVTATASFLDLRRDAKIATLNQVAATLDANFQTVRVASQVQGSGTAVLVNGLTIEVLDQAAATAVWGPFGDASIGYPTAQGMARMAGCLGPVGDPPAGFNTPQPCLRDASVTYLVTNNTVGAYFYYLPYGWVLCGITWSPSTPVAGWSAPAGGETNGASLIYETAC